MRRNLLQVRPTLDCYIVVPMDDPAILVPEFRLRCNPGNRPAVGSVAVLADSRYLVREVLDVPGTRNFDVMAVRI